MLHIKRILFPTDYTTCAEGAFSHAAYLADQFDAELHILHAVTGHKHNPADVDLAFTLNDAEVAAQLHLECIQNVVNRSRIYDIPVVQARVQDTTASIAIVDYADRNDIDLIVMGTHGRSGLDHLISGSVAEQVVRLASCPVLTLRNGDGVISNPKIRRLVAPVDFSDHAYAALAYARALADAYGARLDVLHVLDEAVLPHVYGVEPLSIGANEIKARTTHALEEMAGRSGARPDGVHVMVGHPAHDIARFAERSNADLVVISTHGRSGLKRFVMGSVSEAVMRTASCPVFTVKSCGKSLLEAPMAVDSAAAQ